MFGGLKNMVRNLVAEKKRGRPSKDDEGYKPINPESETSEYSDTKTELQIITTEQLMINNLQILNEKLDRIYDLMKEGFKEFGYDLDKQEKKQE